MITKKISADQPKITGRRESTHWRDSLFGAMVHPEQRSTLYIDEFKGFCLNVDKADEGLHPKYSDNLSSRTGTEEEKRVRPSSGALSLFVITDLQALAQEVPITFDTSIQTIEFAGQIARLP